MRRFFLDAEPSPVDGRIVVSGDLFRHMVKVLRLKIDTRVMLCTGDGGELEGTIEAIGKNSLQVIIEETRPGKGSEAGLRITLYQGLPKSEKMELILQKCTELGVSAIVTYPAARSIKKVAADRGQELQERWRRIAREASRQAHRSSVPDVIITSCFSEMLRAADQPVKLLLWEGEQVKRLKQTLDSVPVPESVGILVGPEGGFTPDEVEEAVSCGFIPVSLGTRILRTETAGLAMVSILQFYWGDVG